MPLTFLRFCSRSYRTTILLATITLAVIVSPAFAVNPDEDPVPSFPHLQEQRDAVVEELQDSEAEVSTEANGSFTIEGTGATQPVPLGAAERGAVRPTQLASQSYDPTTGIITFSWDGIGEVTVTPLDRSTPASVYANGSVVSATRVSQHMSEVTLASDRFLEQHLVVGDQHAGVKLITWRYQFTLPAGVTAAATDTGISLAHDGMQLLTIAADVAVDEAGAEFPVDAAWDASSNTMTVAYDGRIHNPTGAVAIDPVFLPFVSDNEIFVMNVCQVPGTSLLCEAVPGTGLPPRFARFPNSHDNFVTGRNADLGIYIHGEFGKVIPAGAKGMVTYEALPDTTVAGMALHATLQPASGAFQCRAELLNKTAGVYSLAKASGWGSYGTDISDPSRIRLSTFAIDEGTVSGLLDPGAEYAAMRLENTSGADQTVALPNSPVMCSMKGDEVAVGAQQADLFSVYLRDKHKPVITHVLDPASNRADQIHFVPGVNWNGGDYETTTKLFEQSWYRAGEATKFVAEAADKGSGVDRIQITRPNEPLPDAQVSGSSVARTIDACASNTDTYQSPCPTDSRVWDWPTTLPAGLRQGLNSVWYRATDFSGNRTDTGPLNFLYDSVAPTAPSATFGTGNEPTTADADADLPTFDTREAVIVRWDQATDPGQDTHPATGSGIASYQIRVEERTAYGSWKPASAHPEVMTPPVPSGADAPVSLDIAGREGIYRVLMTATDRAGNTGPAAVRFFRIDTTDPIVSLKAPVGEDDIQLRSSAAADQIQASMVDPSVGGGDTLSTALTALSILGNNDPIDVVALQQRVDASANGWADVASQVGQRWTSNTVYDPGALTSISGDGLQEYRISARDGLRADGSYWHNGASRAFKVCLDTALHDRIDLRPASVTAVPISYPNSDTHGARIEFRVSAASPGVYKWMVEARVGAEWVEVAAPLHQSGQSTYRVDDWAARVGVTTYRVSAASQWCTHRGDANIGVEATTSGVQLIVEQPERVMPLLGLESRWSYWSLPVGGGTDSHVNTATGNVVVTRPLLSEPGMGLWTNVNLTYNSQQVGDDELLASNGVAGAHMTLAVGPGGSSADADVAASGFRVSEDAIVMRDADGTIRVFKPTLATTNPNWNGKYTATDGARLLLRNVVVARAFAQRTGQPDDDLSDGVAQTVFKLTRPDGVTYYYARDRSIHTVAQSELGRLLAVRDREGHQLTYKYECVAVNRDAVGVVRANRIQLLGGTWTQVPHDFEPTIVDACPDSVNLVAGATPGSSLRMRLIAVRDQRYGSDHGRQIRIDYHSPQSETPGHVSSIRGHIDGGQARNVSLGYKLSGSTVQLRTVTITGRHGESRKVEYEYDAAMNDPGRWFDKNVILGTVTDFKGQKTRFNYSVPDADAGFLFVNPRATRVENRKDVLRGDGRGVTFNYHLKPGFGPDGIFAMRLSGATTLRDQLERPTRYVWKGDDPFASDYGVTGAVIEPGGLTTHMAWNDHNELTQTRRTIPRIENEAVFIPPSGRSRVLTTPVITGTVELPSKSYSIDASGVVTAAPGVRTQPGHTIKVSYTPDSSRDVVTDIDRNAQSGLPDNITDDKRWRVALGDRLRSSYGGGADRPRTNLAWAASGGPTSTRTIIRDLTSIVMPMGGEHRTDIDVDPETGRVLSVDTPGGSGSRSVQRLTYYPNGMLRSSTDALGWTIAYAGYTDDGKATIISRRFCVAVAGSACGATLAGWSTGLSDAQVADVTTPAFSVLYTPESEISCVRDFRGDAGDDHARFVSFAYDDFGNITAETSPWKRENGRVRRMSRYTYDLNGNLQRTASNGDYKLDGSFSASDCTSFPATGPMTTASHDDGDMKDTAYDELDRVVLAHTASNNHDGQARKSRTRYDLVGNVEFQSQPNHEAGSAGFDYSTTIEYDDRDRSIDVIDGERRHTCTYYDAWDNPVAVTPARWQGRDECPLAPDLAKSSLQSFDNAGAAVSSRSITGKVSFTLTDDEGNAVRSEENGAEREARTIALQSNLRVTTRAFDAAGNVTQELLPRRSACAGATLKSCTPGSADELSPKVSRTYDELNQLVSTRTARQNGESGLTTTNSAAYGYDADGRRVTETLARGSESARVARTIYDPFGNALRVTLANSGPSSLQEEFSTFFAYDDDDSVVLKDDRAHDVRTTWGYDRRGLAISRTEHGTGFGAHEWDSQQKYSFYDDGSLERGPMAVAPFVANRVYADGTCLRASTSSQSNPAFVFLVIGDQQHSSAGKDPGLAQASWKPGQIRSSGDIRLRKLAYGDGALRTYDENGQPLKVSGCGTSISWTRRDGVGAPLEITNPDGGDMNMRYDNGGALVETRYPDGRSRTSRYIQPDEDPFTADPGAGLEEIVALDRPNLKKRYLQMSYAYTLDGAIDIEGRSATGIYKANGTSIDGLDPTGFTTYEYDEVGSLAQTRVLKPGAAQKKATKSNAKSKAQNATRALLEYAKPASPPSKPAKPAAPGNPVTPADSSGRKVGLQGLELLQEDVLRDLSGNPRRVVTSIHRTNVKAKKNPIRTQTRFYGYDVLDRIAEDDVSALPQREYRYDGFGRLDRVLASGLALQDYGYSNASRGAMLTRSVVNGLTDATRQLTVMEYGNGRDEITASGVEGPLGQLVRTTRYDGKTASSGLDELTSYSYTHLNQQAAAIEQKLEPAKAKQKKSDKKRKKTDKTSSYMNYDLLGRRSSTNDYADDLSDTSKVKRTSTLAQFAGDAADPYSESTSDPQQPGTRWMLYGNGRLAGELREQTARYHVGNHQGSTLMTITANKQQDIYATFDYDTWGEPLTGEISLESGTAAALRHNIYSYTGMRKSNAGETTYHHARDYRADLKTWLQTDQYMDPVADLGLSTDPTTQQRGMYGGANPIGNVDLDGHAFTPGGCTDYRCTDDSYDPPQRGANPKQPNLANNPASASPGPAYAGNGRYKNTTGGSDAAVAAYAYAEAASVLDRPNAAQQGAMNYIDAQSGHWQAVTARCLARVQNQKCPGHGPVSAREVGFNAGAAAALAGGLFGNFSSAGPRPRGNATRGFTEPESIGTTAGLCGQNCGGVPDIPAGYQSRFADNFKGTVWQKPGSVGDANSIRIMEPTERYPNGYYRVYNSNGYAVNAAGQQASHAETHFSFDSWPWS